MQHFHRWCCFPAASCLQTKPYVATQLQIQRSFSWLWAMERRFKHILCRPGSSVPHLPRTRGSPASHPLENQVDAVGFNSTKHKGNFLMPSFPAKEWKRTTESTHFFFIIIIKFWMLLESSALWPSHAPAQQTEAQELLQQQLNNCVQSSLERKLTERHWFNWLMI